MPVTRCRNRHCRKPRREKKLFCSDDCQRGNTRNRRRDRRRVAKTHWTLHGEHTRLQESSRWWCCDCESEFPANELGDHQDEDHDVILLSHDRRCRTCNRPVSTPDPYCDNQCHDEFWSRRFPGKAIDDIVYSDEYSLLNGLFGELPHGQYAEIFGTEDDPVNHGFQLDPERWNADNRRSTVLPKW